MKLTDTPLLSSTPASYSDTTPPPPVTKAYLRRWYILFAFSFVSFNQSLFWITFSPISELSQDYFHISESTVQLMLNWGPIIYIPTIPVAMWFASTHGLRIVMLASAVMGLLCALLRCVVVFWPETFVASHGGNKILGLTLVHAAQILNAACGPLVMATPSQLSQTWFPDNEHTTATAISVLSNSFGPATGFLLGPALVHSGHPNQIQKLLYAHLGSAVLGLLFVAVYFPNAPPIPPSLTATTLQSSKPSRDSTLIPPHNTSNNNNKSNHNNSSSKLSVRLSLWGQSVLDALRHRQLMVLAVSGGFMNGVYAGWSGVLSNILRPLGYSDTEAGWWSFASTLASIVGGLAVGIIADRWFEKRLKVLLMIVLAAAISSFVWFTLSLPSMLWGGDSGKVPLASSETSLVIAIVLGGFFIGATNPLFFELAVELTYPLAEATSGGLLTLLNNIGCLVFLLIPPSAHSIMNVVLTLTVLLTLAAVLNIREVYLRRDCSFHGLA